jgi:Coenzyme PQQ synthesis protein D (PqqD)
VDYYPTPVPGVLLEEIDEDICLYRPDIDEVLVLNQSAADVWRLADGTLTEAEVLDCLARAYARAPADLAADVDAALTDLIQRGYLYRGEQPDPSANPA